MKVVYLMSNEYAMFVGVSLISMLENNQRDQELEYCLLDDGLSRENRELFSQIFRKYQVKYEILSSKVCFESIKEKYGQELTIFNGSITTWLRSYPDVIFPGYKGVVMYIDGDTVIDGAIHELCELEWNGEILAAMNVSNENLKGFLQLKEEAQIIRNRGMKYFNAGIILFNMQAFYEYGCREIINGAMRKLEQIRFADQTVLNAAIPPDKVLDLDPKFNYVHHLIPRYSKRFKANENLHPIIIHYPGYNTRPWFKESTSNLAFKFTEYQNKSPWQGIKLSYFDSDYYKGESLWLKLKERIMVPVYNTAIFGWYYDKKRGYR